MKKHFSVYAVIFLLTLTHCNGSDGTAPASPSDSVVYGVATVSVDPPPQFITHNYIDMTKITEISKFRSACGHDWSDDFETRRSMKHYFVAGAGTPIYAPADGWIGAAVGEAWGGQKVTIVVKDPIGFFIDLFHVLPARSFTSGEVVKAGELLGTHVGGTWSDIGVVARLPYTDPTQEGPGLAKNLSYFDVMTDAVFAEFQARGAVFRDDFKFTVEYADAHPTEGSTYCDVGDVNWVTLK